MLTCLNCIGHISSYIAKKATSAFIYLFFFLIIFLTKRNFFLFSQLSHNLCNFILQFHFPSLLPSFFPILNSQRSTKSIHTPLTLSPSLLYNHYLRCPLSSICCLLCNLHRNNSISLFILQLSTPTSWVSLRTKSRIDNFGEE